MSIHILPKTILTGLTCLLCDTFFYCLPDSPLDRPYTAPPVPRASFNIDQALARIGLQPIPQKKDGESSQVIDRPITAPPVPSVSVMDRDLTDIGANFAALTQGPTAVDTAFHLDSLSQHILPLERPATSAVDFKLGGLGSAIDVGALLPRRYV